MVAPNEETECQAETAPTRGHGCYPSCAWTRKKCPNTFLALKEVLERRGLLDKPTCIWNMDETGLQLQHPHDLLSPEKALDISKAELVAISS